MKTRILNFDELLKRKSVFLFGPRQTGKSTWLKSKYPEALYINLLSKKVFDEYSTKANALESDLELFHRKSNSPYVIIDEVQKLPHLLDEVHNQIENNKNLRFILTGSSARKLKRQGVNLLGGRASWKSMFPLVFPEIASELKTEKDLTNRLLRGGLPSIYESSNPFEDFDDYIQLYLLEEIKAEGQVRNYEAFHRFLLTATLSNAKQINFTELGSDAQVPPRTVHDYFQILEDTLIGFMLPAFTATPTRKAMTSDKFYLFDTGLTNALLGRTELSFGTPEVGDLFEQFIISEVRAYVSYKNKKVEMMYWRSYSKLEVDLILKGKKQILAIEIKSKNKLQNKDFNGLLAFAEDYPKAKKIVVFNEGHHSIEENKIECIPIFNFLKMLWNDEIISDDF